VEPPPPLTLDLRGEVCPYTFVRTKLALEELAEGGDLLILLDHPAAFKNVPRSLKQDGYPVLSVEMDPAGRTCLVRTRNSKPP
jgi:tRNA 2-thiouridine synthesizing protein A